MWAEQLLIKKGMRQTAQLSPPQVHTPDLGLPGLEDPVPPSWTTIEDDFVLIYVVKQVPSMNVFQNWILFDPPPVTFVHKHTSPKGSKSESHL